MIRGFPRDYKYKFKTGFLLKIDSFKKKRKILRDTTIGFGEEGKTVCPTGSGAVVKTIM